MSNYLNDPSGLVSCRNRVVGDTSPDAQDWCKDRGGYCHYSEVCRVPIPVKAARPMFGLPSREWLLERLAVGGGIAPEYGIAMLDRIEQLERDLEAANAKTT
jgi:hypothetical protein